MPSNVNTAEHEQIAAQLLRECEQNDGLAPLDLDRFWRENETALSDPFGRDIPHMPCAAFTTHECVFDELGVEEDHGRYQSDPAWRYELNVAYNNKAEQIIGRRWLPENKPEDAAARKRFPPHKQLHEIFEAEQIWHDRSWWICEAAESEEQLEALLDRVDKRIETIDALRAFMLPPQWHEQKDELLAAGVTPPRYRGQRGPVTFATSVFGVERLLFLIMDNPDLATRFSDTIRRAMLGMAEVLDAEAGDTPETAPRGFSFADDNCCLVTPEMYELFALPIVKAMFDRYAPDPGDRRFQHSDSEMSHIVPILAKLNMTAVNFGPTVMADFIRSHMPTTVIQGVLAPFTFSRHDERGMVMELLRDYELTKESRGITFCTAGSVNNGSRLTGMRLMMAATQRFARYDGQTV